MSEADDLNGTVVADRYLTSSAACARWRYELPRDAHFQLHLRCEPPFAPLAADARFRALVAKPPPAWGTGC